MEKFKLMTFVLMFVSAFSLQAFNPDSELRAKVDDYLKSSESKPSAELVRELRAGKYESLKWLRDIYWKSELNYNSYRSNKKFLNLFDEVSAQKDAISSMLFWHTNLKDALAEAQIQNKPVLCLQMLGDLREDFSCANSRFFRTLLYSDGVISSNLRENYILCWESVVKVPKVTIEYPDGRKQIQTITGNSMHLILNSDGKILDALPGLYGPFYFNQWLSTFTNPYTLNKLEETQQKRISELKDEALLNKVNAEDWSDIYNENSSSAGNAPVHALRASEISAAKVAIERPIYTGVYQTDKKDLKKPGKISRSTFPFYEKYGFSWENISEQTKTLIAAKKKYSEQELNATVADISDNLAKENIRNEVKLHVQILELLKQENIRTQKDKFVQTVYADIFLTPLDDKNMGLYDKSMFSATTDDGFIEE